MNHRYSYDDWRLFNTVANFHHNTIGGVRVRVAGDRITVSYHETDFFQYDRRTGYWRVDTYGNTRPWFVAKVNACLHAINAEVRMFVEHGRAGAVHASGFAAYGISWFNNRFYKIGV